MGKVTGDFMVLVSPETGMVMHDRSREEIGGNAAAAAMVKFIVMEYVGSCCE